MRTPKYRRDRVIWYLVPILFGMAGVLFSSMLPIAAARFTAIILSVGIPLFSIGNLLARNGGHGGRKLLLGIGMLMLLIGAAVSLLETPGEIIDLSFLSDRGIDLARAVGMASLVLGLGAVLYSSLLAGEAIEEVGERFRLLADQMIEGLVLSAKDGTIVFVNHRFLDMLGVKETDVIGMHSYDMATKLGMVDMLPHIALRSRSIASEYELSYVVRGEEHQFLLTGTPLSDRRGLHAGTLTTLRDITERNRMAKRIEEYAISLESLVQERTQRMVESQEQFRDLLLHMNEGFLTVDESYRIQFANNRICELLKRDAASMLGKEIFDLADAPGRLRLMEILQEADEEKNEDNHGTNRIEEFSIVRSDGILIPVVVAVAPVRDIAGLDTKHSLVMTDVSELKHMHHQLEVRARELEIANEELRMHGQARDSFLSNVSHELRTPLSTINGYIEMLLSGSLGEMPGTQLSALKVMERNASRLVGLINEMIEFSRMEIRGIKLRVSLFNPAKLLQEALSSIKPQAVAKDLVTSMYIPESFPPIWADRERLIQVLGILLSNAVKFSKQGGMIQVQISEPESHTLSIAVRDTGIGIDPKYHARVFDKFFQVDASISRRYEGTGIGLSIAKNIVEAHGGQLNLESEPGQGSTFSIVLPQVLFDVEIPFSMHEGMDKIKAILVAESDSFRSFMRDMLFNLGLCLHEAHNGFECLRLVEEEQPDIIIFDEIFHDVGGLQMIQSLQDNPAFSTIPVILLALEDPATAQDPIRVTGNFHVILKPFTGKGLIHSIRACCFGEDTTPETTSTSTPYSPVPFVLAVNINEDLNTWLEMALANRHMRYRSIEGLTQIHPVLKESIPDIILVEQDSAGSELHAALETMMLCGTIPTIPICLLIGQESQVTTEVTKVLKKPFSIDELILTIQDLRHPTVI